MIILEEHFPIKSGQTFGTNTDGLVFDDSISSDLTFTHYLNGLLTRTDANGLETYEFFYYSPHVSPPKIRSNFHGNESFPQSSEYEFIGKGEKIERVEGVIVNATIRDSNGVSITKSFITSLRFISNQGVDNPYGYSTGVNFNESFPGYYLGYVTGRAEQYIEQLKFFWYRA